jgi:hypothetical protein
MASDPVLKPIDLITLTEAVVELDLLEVFCVE